MDTVLVSKIKQVVAGNFDRSFALYDDFEREYGFFAELARALATFAGLRAVGGSGRPTPVRVLDLGCGFGTSSVVLAEEFGCEVVGLDISPGMVAYGRERLAASRVRLLFGDACDPASALAAAGVPEGFAAVFYNAAIFIIPEIEKSLAAAAKLLTPGGVIAFSSYPELLAADGADLFAPAFERCGLPRPKKQTITGWNAATAALADLCGAGALREGSYEKPFDERFLIALFSIPAQSASLFPRLDYAARREAVAQLFTALRPEAENAKIVWRLAAGKLPS